MANTITHKRSSTSGVVPAASGLSQGELAINIADGKFYTKNNTNSVINLGVTSISGTYITPASGNFNYLAVSGVPVSVSGHSHLSVPQAQSIVTNVFNKTASTIPKFSVVYINGGQGDQPTIQLAIANVESGSSKTYGITAEAIGSMSAGSVIVAGALSGVNTDQFNPTAPVGDVNGITLYLSPSVSGAATTTKPYSPNHLVSIGTIVRTHQNAGVVEVRVQNGFELDELHNVAISGVTNSQFLQYNSSSGLWLASSNGTFETINVTGPAVSSGSLVSFTHPDNTGSGNYDVIISGQLHLTRAANSGIYNLAAEANWNQSLSPSGTLWNNDGWSNLTNFKSRTYLTLWNAVGGSLGANLPNAELIMKHVPTDRYWKVKFTSWTQGSGGGFVYERQEIFIDNAINVSGISNFNDLLTANQLSASGLTCQKLSVIGEDLTYGGQSPSISLKGYSWFGKADGSVGIAVSVNNAGTFGSSSAFATFGGFNESVTAYTPMCFASNFSAQLYLNTNGNVGINTATPSEKLDVNGNIKTNSNLKINNTSLSESQLINIINGGNLYLWSNFR